MAYSPAQASSLVHLFDLAPSLWSANVLKTRLVLNYKSIPYTESAICYPDIAPLLKSLGVHPHAPESKQPAPYTLPAILHDGMKTSGNKHGALMDSLPIAKYLDDTFDGLDIFPNGEESVQKAIEVNKILGGVVHAGISLIAPNMPSILDERGAEYFARTREARFGKALSQLRPATEEGVQKVLESMKIALTPVVDMLKADSAGPFFEGQTVSYADFVLVAFLGWFERVNFCVFEAVLAVGDGEVRTLWEACQVWLCGRGSEEIWD